MSAYPVGWVMRYVLPSCRPLKPYPMRPDQAPCQRAVPDLAFLTGQSAAFRILPASHLQHEIFRLQQSEPNSQRFHRSLALRIRGDLYARRLIRAIRDLAAAEASLHAVCLEYEGKLFLHLQDRARVHVQTLDLGEVTPEDVDQRLREAANDFVRIPFRLTLEPACRFLLVRLRDEEHVLVSVFHLIQFDDDSERIFLRKLRDAYAGADTPLRSNPPYPLEEDMSLTGLREAEYLVSERWDKDLVFWREALQSRMTPIAWPLVRPGSTTRSGQGMQTGYRRFTLNRSLCRSIDIFCEQRGVERSVFYLTAFCVLLQRHLGNTGIAMGVSVGTIPASEVQRGIGLGRSHLPLGIGLDGSSAFLDLAHRVSSSVAENRLRHHTSFSVLRTQIDGAATSAAPFPGILFRCMTDLLEGIRMEGLELSPYELRSEAETSGLSVTLSFRHDEGSIPQMDILYRYDMSVLSKAWVSRLHARWEMVLQHCVCDPHAATGTYQILPPREWRRVVEEWNATCVDDTPPTTLQDLFRRQAKLSPDRPAVVSETGEMSYRALNEASDRVARHLLELGVRPDEPVALFMGRSQLLMSVIMGVLKSGACIMPVEIYQPPDRVALMLSDSGIRFLVCDRRKPESVPAGIRMLQAAELVADTDTGHPETWLTKGRPEGLAYILYTSGSTGKPKGVMVEHRNIVNRLEHTRRVLGFGPDDRTLQKTPVSFDVCITEFFLPLLCGGAVVMARDERLLTPEYMADAIRRHRATYVHFVATMLQAFLRTEGVERVNGILRHIRCGGESLPERLMQECLRRLDARLYQSYGPAETAVAVTIWPCHTGHGYPKPPIGTPNANTVIHILNEYGRPVPPGVTGELYIGGAQVGRGYLNNPGLTALSFVADPIDPASGTRFYRSGDTAMYADDGNIIFCGRIDGQVKIMGQRVEPSETAHRLMECPGVVQAVVLPKMSASGCHLNAYFVVGSGFPGMPDIRAKLEKGLPAHMIPRNFHQVDHIPVTPNGKTDSDALRRMVARPNLPSSNDDQTEDYPLTPTEASLGTLWRQLIPAADPRRNDHFLQVGGDSLKLLQLVTMVETRWGRTLRTGDLFSNLRLSEMAALIDGSPSIGLTIPDGNDLSPITIFSGNTGRKAFVMVGGGGSLEEYPKYHRLGQLSGLDIDWVILPDPESIGRRIPTTPIAKLAATYAACIRQCQPAGPWWLVGDCIAAYDLHATARALELSTGGKTHCILLDPVLPAALNRTIPLDEARCLGLPALRSGPLHRILFRMLLGTGMIRWMLRHGYTAPKEEEQLRLLAEKTGLFHGVWYVSQYPQAQCTPQTAFQHYLQHGFREGYLPSPDFNAFRYGRACPDFQPGEHEPVTHALLCGFHHRATRRKVLALSGKGIERKDISKARHHLRKSGFDTKPITGNLTLVLSESADAEALLQAWRPLTTGHIFISHAEGDHASYLGEHLPATATILASIMQDIHADTLTHPSSMPAPEAITKPARSIWTGNGPASGLALASGA